MVQPTGEGMIMTVEKVGIVGAGQMGNGIAHVFALADYEVLMTDISQDALNAAVELIERNLDRQVSKDLITESQKTEAMKRIGTTPTLTDLGKTDLIIEAATERETIKTAIFEDLVPHLKPDTILTSNTSSISPRTIIAVTVAASSHRTVSTRPSDRPSRA